MEAVGNIWLYINSTGGVSNRTSYGGTLVSGADKYRTLYPYNSSSDTDLNNWTAYKNLQSNTRGYGDAMLETASSGNGLNSWDGGYSYFIFSANPFSIRGGFYNIGEGAGLFSFARTSGSSSYHNGFRATLVG